MAELIPAPSELPAYEPDRISVNAQLTARAGGQIHQLKPGRPRRFAPRFPIGLRLTLDLATVVPHEIHGARIVAQGLRGPAVLDAVAVR